MRRCDLILRRRRRRVKRERDALERDARERERARGRSSASPFYNNKQTLPATPPTTTTGRRVAGSPKQGRQERERESTSTGRMTLHTTLLFPGFRRYVP